MKSTSALRVLTVSVTAAFAVFIIDAGAAVNAQGDAVKPDETEPKAIVLKCPVDATEVTYELKKLPSGIAIEDRDFCIRLVPDIISFRTISLYPARIAKCPTCGFAAPPSSDMWNDAGKVGGWFKVNYLDVGGGAGKPALSAPPWTDFERYAYALGAVGADAAERERALAWLDASYCLRTAFWEEHPRWEADVLSAVSELRAATPLDIAPVTPKRLYEETIEVPTYFKDLLMESAATAPALGVLGVYWLARGETTRATYCIDALDEVEKTLDARLAGDGPSLLRDIGKSGLLDTLREYQSAAAELFEQALAKGQITARETPVVYFHLGELYRRTGDFDNAERYYKLAIPASATSEDIAARARSGLELVAADRALKTALDDFVTGDFIDTLPLDSVVKDNGADEEVEGPVGNAIVIGKKKPEFPHHPAWAASFFGKVISQFDSHSTG